MHCYSLAVTEGKRGARVFVASPVSVSLRLISRQREALLIAFSHEAIPGFSLKGKRPARNGRMVDFTNGCDIVQ
jgi:hypothetical protein